MTIDKNITYKKYNRLFRLLVMAFLGFTTASFIFIRFGSLTWATYWRISRVILLILLVMFGIRLYISRLKNNLN